MATPKRPHLSAAAATASPSTPLNALDVLLPSLTAYCCSTGIVMVSKTSPGLIHHAPVTAYPTPISRALFSQAYALAQPFNLLVDRLSRDPETLLSMLSDALSDPFTARLVSLYKLYGGPRSKQPLCLGIHRSDYMIDAPTHSLKQIELNTIAASFACLSARVTLLHRYLLTGPCTVDGISPPHLPSPPFREEDLPHNQAETSLAAALAAAHTAYARHPSVVAFIVQPDERNEFDQRHLEHTLLAAHRVHVKRLTLAQMHARGRLDAAGRLWVDEHHEIAVVYFRAGYRPEDLPGEDEWAARALIEQSLAVKCPSVGYHLAGAKKVQQALAKPGAVERFLDPADAALVRSCFAGLWSLGADADPQIIAKARADPDKFVLKPQREGGGNNFYNDQVKIQLEQMSRHELSAHILMERIFPRPQKTFLVREGQATSGLALSELGIYSSFLGDGNATLLNRAAGHLLRTKLDGVDEGGVASGFACLDSPFLVD